VGTDPASTAIDAAESASGRPHWRMSRSGMATRRSMQSSAAMSCSSFQTRRPPSLAQAVVRWSRRN